MMRRSYLFAIAFALMTASVAESQFPILDMIADNVIQKYQQSTCEQLWVQKGAPKTARQQEAIQMLRNEPQMRLAFINRVAAPVVNKMFECGMIP